MSQTLGDLIVRVGASIDDFQSAMRGVQDELKGLESGVEKTGGSIQATFNEAMQGIANRSSEVKEQFAGIEAGSMSLLIAGAELYEAFTEPLKRIAEGAVEAAAETEKLQIVMTTLLGSSSLAGAFVESLHQFAAGSPLSLPSIEQGAQRLLAFQFAGKDVIPILKTLGDVSAAFGQGDEGVGTLVGILGKIEETGSVSGRLVNSLKQFGGISALSLGLGKSQEETLSLVKKPGGIEATEGINALLKGWNEMFGGTAQSEMAGFTGMMANLKNQVTLTLDAIGQQLLPVGRLLVEWARSGQESIRGLVGWFAQLPAPVQAAAGSIPLLVASIGPLLLSLAAFGFFVPNIVRAVTLISESFGLLRIAWVAVTATIAEEGLGAALVGAISAPAIAIPLAIAAIVAALAALATWVFTHWAGVKAALMEGWDGLKEFWQGTLGAAINWVITAFELMGQSLGVVWGGIEESQKSVFARMLDGAKSFWEKTKSDVIDPMMTSFKILIASLPGGVKILGVGAAFEKGESDKKEQDGLDAARKTLHLDDSEFGGLHDSFKEKHKAEVEAAGTALRTIRKEYDDGKVSVEELTKATNRFWDVYNKQPEKRGDLEGKAGKLGLDRSAIDALSAEHTHEEAGFSRERSVIEHNFQLSKPGSGEFDPFTSSVIDTTAAAKRRQELDAVAKEELDATNREIDGKMAAYAKMYASQKDGTTKLKDEDIKLNGERTAANDKYEAEILKNKQSQETAFKQIDDRLDADNRRRNEQRLNEEKRMADESLRIEREHMDAQSRLAEIGRETSRKFEEAKRQLATQNLDAELDIGGITKQRYLTEKQKLFDAEYEQDRKDLQAERKQLQDNYDAELNDLKAHLAAMQALAAAGDEKAPAEVLRTQGAIQRSEDTFKIENARLDQKGQGIDQTHGINTASIGKQKEQDLFDKSGFKAFENSFASGITGMIEGTKTFRQAWQSMVASMLNTWISSLAQQAAHWVAHKLFELVFHTTVEQAKVAVTAGAAAQSNSISLAHHLKEVTRTAAQAAAHAFNAVVGIPFVGPILAPIAAAGAFVAVEAFGLVSAEQGALLPNENSIVLAHPNEMVLPAPLSRGIQKMIGDGTNQQALNGAISSQEHTILLEEISNYTRKTAENTANTFKNAAKTALHQGVIGGIFGFLKGLAPIPFFEDGGITSGDGMAYLHAKEMVLPSHLSLGLSSMIAGVGMSGLGSQVGAAGHHNSFYGDVVYNAAPGERMNVDTFHGLFMTMLRMKNLRIA